MASLPTNRTVANTPNEHVADHNVLHATHNLIDPSGLDAADFVVLNSLAATGPRGVLGYAQVVASQAGITTEVDLTGLSVAVTVAAGRRIRITGHAMFSGSVADNIAGFFINEGATRLQERGALCRPATWNMLAHAEVVLTPSAGAHTYKLRGLLWGGSGTVTMYAAATGPAFILVEDIGT